MAKAPDPTAPDKPLRVKAKKDGFYGGHRIRAGKVFTLSKASDFTDKWMVRVEADTPDDVERALNAPREVAQRTVRGAKHDTQPRKDGDVI